MSLLTPICEINVTVWHILWNVPEMTEFYVLSSPVTGMFTQGMASKIGRIAQKLSVNITALDIFLHFNVSLKHFLKFHS